MRYVTIGIPKMRTRSSHRLQVMIIPPDIGGTELRYASITPRAYLVVAGRCERYPMLAAVSKTSAKVGPVI